MRFNLITFLISFVFLFSSATNAQKTLTEGTLVYNISVETGTGEPKIGDMFDGATTTIYLKGSMSRTELVSSLGRSITIHDASKGTAVTLRDYGTDKLMTTFTAQNWAQNNSKFDGIIFKNTSETQEIAGFNCKKAIAELKNGTSFTVFYTPDVEIANKSYDPLFKTLPGLPVQYEMEIGKQKLKYTLASISYAPVSASKFEIPKSGYRVRTYEEAMQNK